MEVHVYLISRNGEPKKARSILTKGCGFSSLFINLAKIGKGFTCKVDFQEVRTVWNFEISKACFDLNGRRCREYACGIYIMKVQGYFCPNDAMHLNACV